MRVQRERQHSRRDHTLRDSEASGGAVDTSSHSESTQSVEKLKTEFDDLLDEIDSVLEENAEEFVSQYVQRGGE
mgnify:CR=1 FL=1